MKATTVQIQGVVSQLVDGSIDFDLAKAIIERRVKISDTPQQGRFRFEVDYSVTFEEMIEMGRYDYVNIGISCITEHCFFPKDATGKYTIDADYLHLNRDVEQRELYRELLERDLHGWRPMTMVEELFFGAKYLGEQREYPIVECGSVGEGFRRSIFVLTYQQGDRQLRLLELSPCVFNRNCRFGLVRKGNYLCHQYFISVISVSNSSK